jgi:hypothetical protein
MWTLFIASALAAGDGSVKEVFPAGETATTVFAKTSLTKVGMVQAGATNYEIRCATVNKVKTCDAYDSTGKSVAASTAVATDATNGFTATFPATFAYKTVSYSVKP